METPSALSQELLEAIKANLDAGHFKEALELPNDNKYAAPLKDNCWDLIPHLVERIENDTIITWPALQRCCEKLLLIVAERANPEEALLELIEQSEVAENDARFIAILKPMQTVLERLSQKKGRFLEWCLNTMISYIEKLPVPEDHNLIEREQILMDCDENGRRILKIYTELPTFYDYFVDQISKNKKVSSIKNIVVCFLIDLLGKPFACIDMEYDGKSKCQARVLAEQLFKDICSINDDLYMFLTYVKRKCHPRPKSTAEGVYEDAPDDVFLFDEKLSPISLGVLFYLLLAERLSSPSLPQVYSPVYICQEALALSVILLKQENRYLQTKGLKLGHALLALLPKRSSTSLLASIEHNSFVKTLCVIAIYNSVEPIRKDAIVLLKVYIFKFEDRGRYLILKMLLPTLEHSGMKGYIINIYKDLIMEAMQDDERIYWFKDSRLHDMLKIICKIKEGPSTDLVDSADHIISTLNLLRYLTMRDASNKTGIWNYFKEIEYGFLKELREGLNMAIAHYDLGAKALMGDGNSQDYDMGMKTPLDIMPIENRKHVIDSASNALHLISSLLSRLLECVSNLKKPNN